MDRCIEYWKVNISEMSDPVARKRAVCCEPCSVPICTGSWCYENVTNVVRENPFGFDYPECTEEWMEVYTQHVELREKQVQNYKTFTGPVRKSTICKAAGCRRVFGRRGLIFCTEGCCEEQKRKDDPAPPFLYRDIDDEMMHLLYFKRYWVILQRMSDTVGCIILMKRISWSLLKRRHLRIKNTSNLQSAYTEKTW